MKLANARLIIPTCNAGVWAPLQIAALDSAAVSPAQVLVIDSGSGDGTAEHYHHWGAEVVAIDPADFSHGGTRQWAVHQSIDTELLLYLTQDAIPARRESLRALVAAFDDPRVAVAYGRQLPRPDAGAIEAHARLFNYPAASALVSLADRERLGCKLAFSSNSFAAYRRSALLAVGGFPHDAAFAEDQIAAARLLMAGHHKAYIAEATVFHSHAYSVRQDFERAREIGVFHACNPWLLKAFGPAEGEGLRFVRSELAHLAVHAPLHLGEALLRTACKYAGYRAGRVRG